MASPFYFGQRLIARYEKDELCSYKSTIIKLVQFHQLSPLGHHTDTASYTCTVAPRSATTIHRYCVSRSCTKNQACHQKPKTPCALIQLNRPHRIRPASIVNQLKEILTEWLPQNALAVKLVPKEDALLRQIITLRISVELNSVADSDPFKTILYLLGGKGAILGFFCSSFFCSSFGSSKTRA